MGSTTNSAVILGWTVTHPCDVTVIAMAQQMCTSASTVGPFKRWYPCYRFAGVVDAVPVDGLDESVPRINWTGVLHRNVEPAYLRSSAPSSFASGSSTNSES